MKTLKIKAARLILAALLLTAAVFQAGCYSNRKSDIEAVKEVTEKFITGFATGDIKKATEYAEAGFSYHIINQDESAILFKLASKTEIISFENVETNKKNGKARATVRLSYIDISSFSVDAVREKHYLNRNDYLEAADSYQDRQQIDIDLEYRFSKDERRWVVKVSSANKYMDLFEKPQYLNIVNVSVSDEEDLVKSLFDQFAEGNFTTAQYPLDTDLMNVFGAPVSSRNTEAVTEFAKAYFRYIKDHGIEFISDPSNPYKLTVKGHAPSKEAMLRFVSSDEMMMEKARTQIKWQFFIGGDEAWNDYYYGIYSQMAQKISDMPEEDYSLQVSVDPWDDELKIKLYGKGFFQLTFGYFYQDMQMPEEGRSDLIKKAAESLLSEGVITKEQYDSYLAAVDYGFDFENDGRGHYAGDTFKANWEGTAGYTNQAFSVVEEYPNYGAGYYYGDSMPDMNGRMIHYSRHTGYVNNVGYFVDGDSITFMFRLIYDDYKAGMEFDYEWNIVGDEDVVKKTYVVAEDGTRIVEITLTDVKLDKGQSIEMYLYSVERQNVMSYVRLTQT